MYTKAIARTRAAKPAIAIPAIGPAPSPCLLDATTAGDDVVAGALDVVAAGAGVEVITPPVAVVVRVAPSTGKGFSPGAKS